MKDFSLTIGKSQNLKQRVLQELDVPQSTKISFWRAELGTRELHPFIDIRFESMKKMFSKDATLYIKLTDFDDTVSTATFQVINTFKMDQLYHLCITH